MSFVRRFSAFPPLDVITEIEGVVVVDLIPQGIFVGRSTGTVCLVGEWPKGPANTPIEVEGDATIRDNFLGFSLSMTNPLSPTTNPYSNGCAFTWLKSKRFRRLILVRTDMSLALGVKIQLTSSPSTAATGSMTAVAGASLVDGQTFTLNDGINPATTFEFDSGGGVAAGNVAVAFTGGDTAATVAASMVAAINGVGAGLRITAGAVVVATFPLTNDNPGTQGNQTITETVANAGFLVSGMSGGAGVFTLPADLTIPAGTRVRDASSPTREFALAQDVTFAAGTILNAAAFTAFDATDLTATYSTRTVSGIPVYSTQGVSESAVSDVDDVDDTDLFRAGIGAGTAYPTIVVTTTTGALDAAPANASPLTVLTSAQIDTRYGDAITSTLPGETATDNIEIIASARQSATIRTALLANAAAASTNSTGRVALLRPPIGTLPAGAISATDPGVGANRADRAIYCYPHVEQNIPELAELDPQETISSSNILIGADASMATVLSNLPPENNPGQTTQPIISGGLLSYIRRFEPNLTGANRPTKFEQSHYVSFKANGVAAIRRDSRLAEWVFQSGITSVNPTLFPGAVTIKRRRMADFLQDSMASIALRYSKLPNTAERYDSLVGDETDFLELMLSPNNPAAQRIAAYSVDSKSGNTSLLQGSGVRVIIFKVTLLDSLDDIVLQTEIGESVVVEATEF